MQKDILIIGAGPAGLSTALHLARYAPQFTNRILILEKAHHPRPKVCAGGLLADAEIILGRLGLDVNDIPHVDAAVARFDFAGKGLVIRMGRTRGGKHADAKKEISSSFRVDPPPLPHALRIIRRDEFDAWLAIKAGERGIEIREGITVKDVLPDAAGVTVVTDRGEFRAEVVVGADGSNGVTTRRVFPHGPLRTARALEVLTPILPSPCFPEINRRQEKRLDREEAAIFDFFPVPAGVAGYTWNFPTQVSEQPMRCWGIYDMNLFADKDRPRLKDVLAQEMRRHGFTLTEANMKAHPIRWFRPFNKLSVPRLLLVGDAAGADGLLGEGISMALGYGWVAARTISTAFTQGDFSFKDYRWQILRSPLGQTLTARWLFGQIVYTLRWRWFQSLLWRGLKPLVIALAWLFILNWGKRMHESPRPSF